MSLREDIFTARNVAMKQRNHAALNTLRVLCSEIKNKEIDLQHELSDADVLAVIKTTVKRLQEAIKDFEKGNRTDLVENNQQEIALLSQYLPAQMSDDEIRAIIKEVLADSAAPHAIGVLIGQVMQRCRGQADGNRVREIVQEALA